MKQAQTVPGAALRATLLQVALAAAATLALTARAEMLLAERFDQNVPDFSPIGSAPAWHVYASHLGRVVDYTTSTPGNNFPCLSHSATVSGVSGAGYLVLGSGEVVSNVLAWMDCSLSIPPDNSTTVSFYTRNDQAISGIRIVVRIGDRWFASPTDFRDSGGNAAWALQSLEFSSAPGWRPLNTNLLALEAPLTVPLPDGSITGIGFFAPSGGVGKTRVDELQVYSGMAVMDPTYHVGSWIWVERERERQTCRFWTVIDIPRQSTVNKARLRITADNSYHVFLDGTEIGQGSEWRRLTEYDLTLLLSEGPHALAVEAFNEVGGAGVVAGVTVDLEDGRILEIPSDTTWRVVPDDQKGWKTRTSPLPNWPRARLVARFQDLPGLPNRPQVLFPSALQPVVVYFWQRGWFQITMLSLSVIAGILYLRLLARLALQSRSQQVLQRERARIARDIHDDLGAGLTQLVLLGEAEQRELSGQPAARAKFERISDAGRRLLSSIDEVVWLVNSQRDSLQDFEAYICRYTENFLRSSAIRCRLDVEAEIPQITFDLATRRTLFLAIKEALNNVVKHSGATEVALTIQVANEEVAVTVEDNGRGFQPADATPGRNGIANLAQRMAEVGGQYELTSQPGHGCRVVLRVPVDEHRRRPDQPSRWGQWLRPQPDRS